VEAFPHIREGAFFLLLDKGIPAPDWQPAETPLLTCIQIYRAWRGETTPAAHQACNGLKEGPNTSFRE
jgi:hypothetical protein